ncbi:unnamed protein product, partial [Polarella glacialis]
RGPRKRSKLEQLEAQSRPAEQAVAEHTANWPFQAGSERAADREDGASKNKVKRRRKGSNDGKGTLDDTDDEGTLSRERAGKKLSEWAENESRLQRWLDSRGALEGRILEGNGSIVRLRDFMPLEIANSALAVMEGLPEKAWDLSEHGGDDDAARHKFSSADVVDIPELAPLRA